MTLSQCPSVRLTALFADLVLLPSMLAGWLGRVIAETDKNADATSISEGPIETANDLTAGPEAVAEQSIPKAAPPTPHVLKPEARRETNSDEATVD